MVRQLPPTSTEAKLELGWQVDENWSPKFWQANGAAVGQHVTSDLVTVPSEFMARHGIIIAQSGSGKSYFLGRLVEELLLKTKARVVILDPNADFRAVNQLKPSIVGGQNEEYPTEELSSYKSDWTKIKKTVFRVNPSGRDGGTQSFELWWPNVNIDVVAQELSLIQRAEFAHCHRFVGLMARLFESSTDHQLPQGLDGLLDRCEQLFFHSKQHDIDNGETFVSSVIDNFRDLFGLRSSREKYEALQRALMPTKYVSDDTGRFYFSRARYFQLAGVLSDRPHAEEYSQRRLTVVDLPSIPDLDTRSLAVSSTLNLAWRVARSEWENALMASPVEDHRVPTFVVLDEAHNLIPNDPRSFSAAAVREQFRTIAAEGRKYGVFLLVATQRPDRLDTQILSEFENKAIMRISSAQVIETIISQLGLTGREASMLQVVPSLGVGRGVLLGRWSGFEPTRFATAARRTVEGGRSLRSEHWTHR
ncbi:MAG: ATP-binding protein [Chloroflexi bacterium]|nr:ATP-binding protein [Chloroflexota bacterium]